MKWLKEIWSWVTIYRLAWSGLCMIFAHGIFNWEPVHGVWAVMILLVYIEGRFGAVLDVVVKAVKDQSAEERRRREIDRIVKGRW